VAVGFWDCCQTMQKSDGKIEICMPETHQETTQHRT
jgi:hypothetical protein